MSTSVLFNDPAFSALHAEMHFPTSLLREKITAAYRLEEQQAVGLLLEQSPQDTALTVQTTQLAKRLVIAVREKRTRASGVDALMHEFSLSSDEGIALMCLAEALLRIPDHHTADRLIADKISRGDWRKHLGVSPSLFVNAATWGLLITGKLVSSNSEQGLGSALTRLIAKGGEPLIRKGVDLAMRMLGNQFVTGETIDDAIVNSRHNEARGYQYSYDMLGEAALTAEDADKYLQSYEQAIHAIGRASAGRGIRNGPGISVKLSALHPRYSRAQRHRVMTELLPRLQSLLLLAKSYDIGLNIDAEESERLELSLDLIEVLAHDPCLAGYDGIGFVVQAYQKRCPFVIDYLIDLARNSGRKFMVRLVKGAYWDAEIKRAQVDGMSGYPVFTRKVYTDVCYLACAEKLLGATDVLYPQFATHNAQTLSAIYTSAQARGVTDYEFQCLHGMGETLYDQVVGKDNLNKPCRIYAPVGSHRTLLAYLVRRLLENGANSSFVNQIVDTNVPVDALIANPMDEARKQGGIPHRNIGLPRAMFGDERANSSGIDLSNEKELARVNQAFVHFGSKQWHAVPMLGTTFSTLASHTVNNPADRRDQVGSVVEANKTDVDAALLAAHDYASAWQAVPASDRATILFHAADLFELHQLELMAMAIREAGKSLPNAIAEVREAVDFLRYYAARITETPTMLALGPVVCISPWNFPLAIFTGQVSAALAAGNVVLAKPAEQTPLIAYRAVQLLHEAGIPRAALQFLPGQGESIGASLVADHRTQGIIFTGSTSVAQLINRTLAKRALVESCDIVLIAETGGQNAMIVDSSALTEQVVQDVISSAFDSAGQRCSALRVLCLQEEIADKTLVMLKGAMRELAVGNPDRLATDIGPVIDMEARDSLLAHVERMRKTGHSVFQLVLSVDTQYGTFVPPTIIEIDSLSELTNEIFGPILHVLRYRSEDLPQIIDAINATGYGLTFGIHSRIDETVNFISNRIHAGNIYINRNIVGAVVGVQPFGGEGKSGTGPKAGGPLYLKRLQRSKDGELSVNIIEIGRGNMHSPALNSLLAWAKAFGHETLFDLGEHYIRHSELGKKLVLPGPTGEINTLLLAARGDILCLAPDITSLLNQLFAVFATGNNPVLLTSSLPLLPVSLPESVRTAIRQISDINDEGQPLQIALIDVSLVAGTRTLLADRGGALVPLIETTLGKSIPLWRLLSERATCTNTTAAGGNASLMMLEE
ncbi:trifunctional transcriptional regulator/proline dehydrogenase/L-glutamate gamma-semialdehyde dehydrogenase [Actimicrobium sp. CCI2.3]|uniref:trifunctional transcriptional regulator/proline dehydrogenase/L-glutamate gamma-semialdehyde dehydrogenase n=1 Tax=Actimicrobium sp. CCI2.3 TaxID=3048616 RepID=UPI003A0FF357